MDERNSKGRNKNENISHAKITEAIVLVKFFASRRVRDVRIIGSTAFHSCDDVFAWEFSIVIWRRIKIAERFLSEDGKPIRNQHRTRGWSSEARGKTLRNFSCFLINVRRWENFLNQSSSSACNPSDVRKVKKIIFNVSMNIHFRRKFMVSPGEDLKSQAREEVKRILNFLTIVNLIAFKNLGGLISSSESGEWRRGKQAFSAGINQMEIGNFRSSLILTFSCSFKELTQLFNIFKSDLADRIRRKSPNPS